MSLIQVSILSIACHSLGICRIFSKLLIFYNILLNFANFRGGGNFEMHADLQQKNRKRRKSRANSPNLLEAFVRWRKEDNLYGHCALNNARRILSKGSTLWRGCWFRSKKLHFRKNFDANSIVVERVKGKNKNSTLRNKNQNSTLKGKIEISPSKSWRYCGSFVFWIVFILVVYAE